MLAASSTAVNGQGRPQLLGRVRDHITAKLGFTEVIDLDQPLNELGILVDVGRLSNSLEQEFGTPVSVRELIKGPTINQLVDGVFRELVGRFSPKGNDAPEATPVAAPIVPARAPVVRSSVVSERAWSKLRADQIAAGAVKIAGDQIQGGLKLQRLTNGRGRIETVMEAAGRGNGSDNRPGVRRDRISRRPSTAMEPTQTISARQSRVPPLRPGCALSGSG